MTELKPCPFCGGEARLFEFPQVRHPDIKNPVGSIYYKAKCTNPECGVWHPSWDDPDKAVQTWNTRAKSGGMMAEIKPSKDGAPVKEIVAEWLKINHYDGLCNPEAECGCGLDDLMPCGRVSAKYCICAYEIADIDGDSYFCTSNSEQDEPSEIRLTLEQRYQQLSEVARDLFNHVLDFNKNKSYFGGVDISDFRKRLEELGVEL